jgi:exopolysaccharide biosynthesis polyprenyl glycosylphosphotransferase
MSSIDKRSFASPKTPLFSYRGIPNFEHKLMLVLLDAVVLFIAAVGFHAVASAFMPEVGQLLTFWDEFVFLLVSWWIFASLNDLYDPFVSRDQNLLTKNVAITIGMVFVLLALVTTLPAYSSNRGFQIALVATSLLLVTAWRFQYATVSKAKRMLHHTLILGDGSRAQAAAELIRKSPKLYYQVQGYVREHAEQCETTLDGLPIWSADEDLIALTDKLAIDAIVIATDHTLDDQQALWLLECQSRGIQVFWLPDFFDKLCQRIPVAHVDPVWMLNAMQQSDGQIKLASKQILDKTLIILALPSLLLIFPILYLLVRFSSPGPIFYRQTRIGYGGKYFTILKFRTMYEDAEKDGKPKWAVDGDPRITPIGRFLRKSHLDELPQLINIFRGDMSLTGPRPERPEFVEELEKVIPYYRIRQLVKPGLTGWAQVKYDYGNSVDDARTKLEYDCHYIRNWSVAFDIYIIFRTIFVSIGGKGT